MSLGNLPRLPRAGSMPTTRRVRLQETQSPEGSPEGTRLMLSWAGASGGLGSVVPMLSVLPDRQLGPHVHLWKNYMNKFITTCLMTRSFGRRFQQTHVNHTDHAPLSRLNSLQSFPPLRLGPKLLIAVMGPHSSLTLPSTLAALSLLPPQQPLSLPWKYLFGSQLYSPH